MSKKNKARRGAPAGQAAAAKAPASRAPASTAPASTAPASTAPASTAPAGRGRTEADAIVERVLSSLWTAIASGDPLRAELETATCMAIPYVAGQKDPAEIDTFISTVLVDGAVRRRAPEGAAMLRLLMVLGTQDVKRAASRALAELTGAGIYPPEWVTEIGKVTPGQAWRRYDVFGDDEAVAVTFGYGEAEHGIVVQVDLAGIPVATAIGVSSDAARLIEAFSGNDEEFDRSEQISLAEARDRLYIPLDRTEREPDLGLSPEQRRVPAGRPVPGPPPPGRRRPAWPGIHRGRPRGRGRRVHEEPAGRGGRRGRRGIHPVLGRGAHRLQRPPPRRAARPGGPAQARAHSPRPRAEHLRPVPRPARLTSSPRWPRGSAGPRTTGTWARPGPRC